MTSGPVVTLSSLASSCLTGIRQVMPPPAAVQGNDWRSLAVAPLMDFEPVLGVSVIVTYYEAPDALELTLAALECQDYPRELFEVVIVDDGSTTPLAAPADSPLSLQVLHQQDQGFGLARARNTGAAAAKQPILVFLDCDMCPEAGWLTAHARWHHAACDVLTLGFRAHVDVEGITSEQIRNRSGSLQDLFAGRPCQRPKWIDDHMSRTDDLTSNADDIFRAVTGGNLGISKAFYEAVGGYDESFTQWGAEDIEFGYRAYTRGAVLAPERSAFCWHQGEGATPSAEESASLELQRAKISQLIAHQGFRRDSPGRSFTVPQYVVTLRAPKSGGVTRLETVEQILAGNVHDLVIWIEEPLGADISRSNDHEKIRRLLAGDPRVRFGAVGAAVKTFPAASFHITTPGDAVIGTDTIARLRQHLGDDPAASTDPLNPQAAVSIVRSWVLHRAARRGVGVTQCEAVKPLDLTALEVTDTNAGPPIAIRRLQLFLQRLGRFAKRNLKRFAAVNKSVIREASQIRSTDDAREFGWWASSSIKSISDKRLEEAESLLRTQRQARYRLGPEIATAGPVSSSVFGAATEVSESLDAKTQVLVADTAEHAAAATGGISKTRVAEHLKVETVLLSELAPSASVAAFNAEKFNPVGWSCTFRKPSTTTAMLRRGLDPVRFRKLASAHHVEDSANAHRDTRSRAATLAAMTARGAVVRLTEPDPELEQLLGEELYSLMLDERIPTADVHTREALSIAMRRCALRDHSLRARARQVLAGSRHRAPALPLVSVLLATRRPHLVEAAVQAVARQSYPRIELVLATHGEGFDKAAINAVLESVDFATSTVAVAAEEPLGSVLNAAVKASNGELLTKFDDDDFYGPQHLWDLVLAHEYSQAALVGKAAEYVYLAGSDRTIQRFRNRSERPSRTLAGGALLISRHHLDSVLGWRSIPSGVDRALINDVRTAKLGTYRTHASGYMLVRHAEGHTWPAADTYFLKQADEVRDGCDLEFAGIEQHQEDT